MNSYLNVFKLFNIFIICHYYYFKFWIKCVSLILIPLCLLHSHEKTENHMSSPQIGMVRKAEIRNSAAVTWHVRRRGSASASSSSSAASVQVPAAPWKKKTKKTKTWEERNNGTHIAFMEPTSAFNVTASVSPLTAYTWIKVYANGDGERG